MLEMVACQSGDSMSRGSGQYKHLDIVSHAAFRRLVTSIAALMTVAMVSIQLTEMRWTSVKGCRTVRIHWLSMQKCLTSHVGSVFSRYDAMNELILSSVLT